MKERILAIDPGNRFSAYCLIDSDFSRVIKFDKVENHELESVIATLALQDAFEICVIEMVGHYGTGMPAGQEVFDTCVEIGRLSRICDEYRKEQYYIKRPTVKTMVCGNPRAKDSNVIQALKDKFGDKGTKKNPGYFYGFHADCWQAFACGYAWVRYWSLELGDNNVVWRLC